MINYSFYYNKKIIYRKLLIVQAENPYSEKKMKQNQKI